MQHLIRTLQFTQFISNGVFFLNLRFKMSVLSSCDHVQTLQKVQHQALSQ